MTEPIQPYYIPAFSSSVTAHLMEIGELINKLNEEYGELKHLVHRGDLQRILFQLVNVRKTANALSRETTTAQYAAENTVGHEQIAEAIDLARRKA